MTLRLLSTLVLTGWFASVAHAEVTVDVQPGPGKPGDVLLFTVRGADKLPTGTLGKNALPFIRHGKVYQAFTSLPVELEPGALPFQVEAEDAEGGRPIEGEVEVEDPRFPSRELKVDNKFVKPPPSVRRQIKEDRAAFARAFGQKLQGRTFKGAFTWPRKATITAPFGDLRLFNGKKQSQHFGMDLDGRIGDPVFAANDGTVILVRKAYASGDTVLLHHGAGIYTAYFHLSKFDVEQGQKVKRGDRLGSVGKSGRVTGPHLHFGAKVDGRWVDPQSLLELPL